MFSNIKALAIVAVTTQATSLLEKEDFKGTTDDFGVTWKWECDNPAHTLSDYVDMSEWCFFDGQCAYIEETGECIQNWCE